MFQQFSHFFSFCLHYHILLYPLPLSLRFYREPLFLFWMLAMILGIFSVYPEMSDLSLPLALLPLFPRVLAEIQHQYVMVVAWAASLCLGPVFYWMWMSHSGNANFYYVITLLYNLTHIALTALMMQVM
jgi:phosphatidylinositol glycan class U